jgi:hypothetical protein
MLKEKNILSVQYTESLLQNVAIYSGIFLHDKFRYIHGNYVRALLLIDIYIARGK